MNITLIIATLVFVSIVLLCAGIYFIQNYAREHGRLIKRIENQDEPDIEQGVSTEYKAKPFNAIQRMFLPIVTALGSLMKPKDKEKLSRVMKVLIMAGYRKQNGPIIFFGIKAFCAVLLPGALFLVRVLFFKMFPPSLFMVLCIALALAGFYLPNGWVRLKIGRRQNKILEGFPDALDLLVVCVEAGMGLDAAIKRVGDEMKLSNKVLSDEFHLVNLETRAGKSRESAYKNLALRTGLDDVSSFITLIIQTERFGTSMARSLRVHSDAMRTKRTQRAEEAAAKLPVKLIFPLILFIFPTIFAVVVGPAVIRVIRVLFPAMAGQ